MRREAVFVVGEGTVTALAGGPISIADLGARTTKRASNLVFNPNTNLWVAIDAATHEVVCSDVDYDIALQKEQDHYNRQLAAAWTPRLHEILSNEP